MIELTDQQQQIVAHNHGPALVFAVAGAGKTTAMVRRVERLARERVFDPRRILVSSFSKAAVDDLGRAMAAWPHCRPVARLTLHALGYKIVHDAAARGLLPPLAEGALKTNGAERALVWAARDLARQRNLVPPSELDSLDEQDFQTFVGACKGNLRYADLAAAHLPAHAAVPVATQASAPPGLPWYLDLYRLHEEVRQSRGWLTFDDMLMLGWECLIRHGELLRFWRQRYEAVIVDEFQDVNLAQAELLDLLVAEHGNYMAIGDEDQTIYGFRGASVRFFRGFAARYGATVYEMSDNFRCQAAQVVLAGQVIGQDRARRPRSPVVTQGFAGHVQLRRSPDLMAMARQLAHDVTAALAAGHAPSAIAILVRLNAQTPPLEQALVAAKIAYRIVGEEPFFRRREILDLLRYVDLAAYDAQLRTGQRLHGEIAEQFEACWRALYNRPRRYLSRQLFQETLTAALRQGRPLSESLLELRDKVTGRTAGAIQTLADLLVWLNEAQATLPADQLLTTLDQRLGYRDFLATSSGSPETGAGYVASVTAFLTYARGRGTLAELETHLNELAAAQADLAASGQEVVEIRTIHGAKGLEWPVVLVPGCNDGVLPFGGADDLDEERRLLYVAITRARRELILYAVSSGESRLSSFLTAAQVEQVLIQVATVGAALGRDPATWTAATTLAVARYPRAYGQARQLSHWWPGDPAARPQVAARVLGLIAAVNARNRLHELGLDAQDAALWAALAPAEQHPLLSAPFADFDQICPPVVAAVPKPVSAPVPASKPASPTSYRVGDRVKHPQFGPGRVMAVEAETRRRKQEWYLVVEFRSRGMVKLLASIAPLERLD
ncbi:MAG: ATP-dependent helicase [Oscillochloridaceae bacterium umkhey_bin13]